MKPGIGLTDIFFSYSSKDRDRVEAAHKALTERGFEVFWDLQVPAGIDWDRWIHARLDQSRCVIVFWTANSAASRNVRHEVAIAAEDGKLLQVMLEPLAARNLPMGALADQAVKLMKWCGDATDPEWGKLIVAVEEKATPRWLRQKVHGLEIALRDERHRVSEADTKARTLEDVHAREVAAQGDLRRERDKLKGERDQLWQSVREFEVALKGERQKAAEAAAGVQAAEEAYARESEARSNICRERDWLKTSLQAAQEKAAEREARLRAQEEAYVRQMTAQDTLRRERDELRKERDLFVAERDTLITECERMKKAAAGRSAAAKSPETAGRAKRARLSWFISGVVDAMMILAALSLVLTPFFLYLLFLFSPLIESALLGVNVIDHPNMFDGLFIRSLHVLAMVICLIVNALIWLMSTSYFDRLTTVAAVSIVAPVAAWAVPAFVSFTNSWSLVYVFLAIIAYGVYQALGIAGGFGEGIKKLT
jgi:hypothetical protein